MNWDKANDEDDLAGLDPVERLGYKVTRLQSTLDEEKEAKKFAVRIVGAVLALFLLLGVIGFWQNNQRIDDTDREAIKRCEAAKTGREALRELIFVAIGDSNRDGERDQPGGAIDPDVILSTPQFQALSPEDLAAWELVLRGLTNDSGTSTSDRLVAYAESLPPITCT